MLIGTTPIQNRRPTDGGGIQAAPPIGAGVAISLIDDRRPNTVRIWSEELAMTNALRIRPLSYLKANAAEILLDLADSR